MMIRFLKPEAKKKIKAHGFKKESSSCRNPEWARRGDGVVLW